MTRRPYLLTLLSGALFGLAILLVYFGSAAAGPSPSEFMPPGFGATPDGLEAAWDWTRYSGALWIAALVAIVVGLRWIRARLEPSPGAVAPEPGSLKARLILWLGIVVAVGAAVVDKMAGEAGWGSVATAAIGAFTLAYRAGDDPMRGSKRVEAVPVVVSGEVVTP
jgi:hypothetical protein